MGMNGYPVYICLVCGRIELTKFACEKCGIRGTVHEVSSPDSLATTGVRKRSAGDTGIPLSNYSDSAIDNCQTPLWAVSLLLKGIPAPHTGIEIWEPAAGDGTIANALQRYGYEVWASDKSEQSNSAVFDVWGSCDYYDDSNDALQYCQMALESNDNKLWIITNPPYKNVWKWLERTIELSNNLNAGWALLVKTATLGQKRFTSLLSKLPYTIHGYAPHGRINFRMPSVGWTGKENDSGTGSQFPTLWLTGNPSSRSDKKMRGKVIIEYIDIEPAPWWEHIPWELTGVTPF